MSGKLHKRGMNIEVVAVSRWSRKKSPREYKNKKGSINKEEDVTTRFKKELSQNNLRSEKERASEVLFEETPAVESVSNVCKA